MTLRRARRERRNHYGERKRVRMYVFFYALTPLPCILRFHCTFISQKNFFFLHAYHPTPRSSHHADLYVPPPPPKYYQILTSLLRNLHYHKSLNKSPLPLQNRAIVPAPSLSCHHIAMAPPHSHRESKPSPKRIKTAINHASHASNCHELVSTYLRHQLTPNSHHH